MSTKTEIPVSSESLVAFRDRGRSMAFDCPSGTENGTRASIYADIEGKKQTGIGYLHRACGKKHGDRFTLQKRN